MGFKTPTKLRLHFSTTELDLIPDGILFCISFVKPFENLSLSGPKLDVVLCFRAEIYPRLFGALDLPSSANCSFFRLGEKTEIGEF